MFELYTERARRVIFFARYEASRYGSTTIETEHMLLGLIRENRYPVAKLLQSGTVEDLCKLVGDRTSVRPKVSTALDLPLTDECKRILKYAGEESEALNHRHIGTEHLLLAMLREPTTLACQLLTQLGADPDRLRQELVRTSQGTTGASSEETPVVDRESVRELLDKLPEEKLGLAKMMMARMLGEHFPGSLMMKMSGGHFRRGPDGEVVEGRFTSSRMEEDALIVQTEHIFRGHRLAITERLQVSEDGKTLSYSQEVDGPNQERHRQAMKFDV